VRRPVGADPVGGEELPDFPSAYRIHLLPRKEALFFWATHIMNISRVHNLTMGRHSDPTLVSHGVWKQTCPRKKILFFHLFEQKSFTCNNLNKFLLVAITQKNIY
jgi:hypothetical protein